MKQFIKVNVTTESNGVHVIPQKDVIISLSAIVLITRRQSNEYTLVLLPQILQELQNSLYGRSAVIKEITAKISDESVLL